MNSNTKFLKINPVLPSENMERDVKYFIEKLGFQNVFDSTAYQEGPMDYAVLRRGDISLHLQMQFPEDMQQTQMPMIRIEVENIEPLHQEYFEKKIHNKLLTNTPWGTKEFGFFTPGKIGITFYEDLK